MAGEKEIRDKIKSIKNTQKITKAMEMVAASKMRKAQERMAATRPYTQKIHNVIGHLALAHPEYRHPFMLEREHAARVGFIIISTDRGLCGGLNINLFKLAVAAIQEWKQKDAEVDLCLIGVKATMFFKRLLSSIVSQTSHLGDLPRITDLIGTVKVMLDRYEDEEIDRLYLAENEFINTMSQKPKVTQLLPIVAAEDESLQHHWDYIYEPDSKEVLGALMTRYVESLIFQGVIENTACEMAARMVAMKSASDNAGELIDELQLMYNKARQASITQEIAEIIGGAAAL